MCVSVGLIAGVTDNSSTDADDLITPLPLLNEESAGITPPQSQFFLHLINDFLMTFSLMRFGEAVQTELVEAARTVQNALFEDHSSFAALEKAAPMMDIFFVFLILLDVFDAL